MVAQLGVDIGLMAGFLALAGGTIIGFASMNTIGNVIAGIIVLISKPFKIGDRILFNKQFADVVPIDLIYTRMKTLDNVLISVPNQQLLTSRALLAGSDSNTLNIQIFSRVKVSRV